MTYEPPPKIFEESVQNFLANATWLSEVDEPMIAAFKKCASELDRLSIKNPAPLLSQFKSIHAYLMGRNPNDEKPKTSDPQGDLVDEILDSRGV